MARTVCGVNACGFFLNVSPRISKFCLNNMRNAVLHGRVVRKAVADRLEDTKVGGQKRQREKSTARPTCYQK